MIFSSQLIPKLLKLCSLMSKHSQMLFVCWNVLSLLRAPPPHSWCFRYLLLCMARHAGSSTARDYCRCNWLFQAWFDTSLLSDPHTSLLSSVMGRRWDSHETFASSHLRRNRLFLLCFYAQGQDRKQRVCVKTRHSQHIRRNRHILALHIYRREKKDNGLAFWKQMKLILIVCAFRQS